MLKGIGSDFSNYTLCQESKGMRRFVCRSPVDLFCFAAISVKFRCLNSSVRKEYFVHTHNPLVLSNKLILNK